MTGKPLYLPRKLADLDTGKRLAQVFTAQDKREAAFTRADGNFIGCENALVSQDSQRPRQPKRGNGPDAVSRDSQDFIFAGHRQARLAEGLTQGGPRNLCWSRHQHHYKAISVQPKKDAANHLLWSLPAFGGSLLQRGHRPCMPEELIRDSKQAKGVCCGGFGWVRHGREYTVKPSISPDPKGQSSL